jgi:hypothetical protein
MEQPVDNDRYTYLPRQKEENYDDAVDQNNEYESYEDENREYEDPKDTNKESGYEIIYKWTDDEGVEHYTNNIKKIPEEFKDIIVKLEVW